jgi:hypothetical protein
MAKIESRFPALKHAMRTPADADRRHLRTSNKNKATPYMRELATVKKN